MSEQFQCAFCERTFARLNGRGQHELKGHPDLFTEEHRRMRALEARRRASRTWYWRHPEEARERARLDASRDRETQHRRFREWYESNRDAINERKRAAYAADPEKARDASIRWRLANRKKALELYRARTTESRRRARTGSRLNGGDAARGAVYRAVRQGRLQLEPCIVCGDERVEAHHYLGYAPEHRLDVQWLCRDHHEEAHHPGILERRARLLRQLETAQAMSRAAERMSVRETLWSDL